MRLEGITKRFPGVVANHDVTFEVERGTVHAIVGENGAGKSTLMKILYGVQRPDEGTIEINGARVDLKTPSDAIKKGIGMVFQHFMLADNLTVTENVVLGAEKLHGIGGAARAEIVRISDQYGLGVDPDALVADLGVGARQRVEILKVLYRGVKVLILDEPTAVLVPQEVDALFANLRLLRDEGTAARTLARVLGASRFTGDLLLASPEAVQMLGDADGLRPREREEILKRMRAAASRRDEADAAVASIRAIRRAEIFRVGVADLQDRLTAAGMAVPMWMMADIDHGDVTSADPEDRKAHV